MKCFNCTWLQFSYKVNMAGRFHKIICSPVTLILIAFAAFVNMYFVVMKSGARVMGADGISYIAAARECVNGKGLYIPDGSGHFTPLVHWPPGFPLTLALFSFFGIESYDAARILNSLLLAGSGLIVAFLLRTYGPKISWLPCFGLLFFISSTTVLKIHAAALSDALFAFCTLCGFALLLKYLKTGSNVVLIGASFFIGWAFFTRYVGVVVFLVGLVVIFVYRRSNLKTLLLSSATFITLSCLPVGLFMLRNILLTAKPTSRTAAWHPPDLGHAEILLSTLMNWFTPSGYSWALRTMVLALALVFFVVIFTAWKPWHAISRHGPCSTNDKLSFLLLMFLFIFAYCSLLLLSMSFFDRATEPDERIMFPIYFTSILIVFTVAGEAWLNTYKNWYGSAIFVVLCCLIMSQTMRSTVWSYVAFSDGLGGYNTAPWLTSQSLASLSKNNTSDLPNIMTNDWGALYFRTGISALEIPSSIYTVKRDLPLGYKVGDRTIDFESNWKHVLKRVNNDWMLIYFNKPMASNKGYFLSINELKSRLKLVQLKEYPDVTVYSID